jgi:hypothetical protein
MERSEMSRSKAQRIKNKMGAAQFGEGENKKRLWEGEGVGRMGEYCCFAKVYSCFFARARDY